MIESKEKLLDTLNDLGLFNKLLVTCKPTERYSECMANIESSDDDEDDTSSDRDKIKILLLFSEYKTRETEDDIRRIINGESIVYDINNNSDEGVKIEGKDSFLDLIAISDFYDVNSYESLKEILLKNEESIDEKRFYNFINIISNNNNLKLLKGFGLDINKIKSKINEYNSKKDLERIKK